VTRAWEKAEPDRMDLTSMIDVVFLLIVFFVLVSEMAQAELEHIQLPEATESVPDRPESRRRLILNVSAGGDIVCRKRVLSEAELAREIRLAADLQRDRANPTLSNLPVLVRGDRRAEYAAVQRILQACAKSGVWQIELAAVAPPAK